jgi:hypothetical protein
VKRHSTHMIGRDIHAGVRIGVAAWARLGVKDHLTSGRVGVRSQCVVVVVRPIHRGVTRSSRENGDGRVVVMKAANWTASRVCGMSIFKSTMAKRKDERNQLVRFLDIYGYTKGRRVEETSRVLVVDGSCGNCRGPMTMGARKVVRRLC